MHLVADRHTHHPLHPWLHQTAPTKRHMAVSSVAHLDVPRPHVASIIHSHGGHYVDVLVHRKAGGGAAGIRPVLNRVTCVCGPMT